MSRRSRTRRSGPFRDRSSIRSGRQPTNAGTFGAAGLPARSGGNLPVRVSGQLLVRLLFPRPICAPFGASRARVELRSREPLRRLPLHRSDPYPLLLRAAQKVDADRTVDLLRVEGAQEVADAGHRLAVERDDEVAGQQSRMGRGPRLVDAEETRAGRLLDAEPERNAARNGHVRRADADIGAPHPPMPGDLAGDKTGGVGG